MSRLTMDDLASEFFYDTKLEYTENDKGYIISEFLDINGNEFTFDINLKGEITIELHWDIVGNGLDLLEISLIGVFDRFGCAYVDGYKPFVYKHTTIKDVVNETRKFLQCIIILDGLCKKGD